MNGELSYEILNIRYWNGCYRSVNDCIWNQKKGRCSSQVVGKITGVHESVGTDSEGSKDYSYSAEYEYVVDGKTYKGYGGRSYSSSGKINVGGDIDIFYNPEKPDDNYTKGGVKIWPYFAFAMFFFGTLSILNAF